jgi:hypothetical protein
MGSLNISEPLLPQRQAFALKPLTLSIEPASWCSPPMAGLMSADKVTLDCCGFCGGSCGIWAYSGTGESAHQTCALCTLAEHLERPRIDEEAMLIWAPEISQPAINKIMRQAHIAVTLLGENVDLRERFLRLSPQRRAAYCTYSIFAQRAAAAAERLGTHLPSELGLALLQLSPPAMIRRRALLHGIRLLPLGHFYEGGKDIYPGIAACWTKLWIQAAGETRDAFAEDDA